MYRPINYDYIDNKIDKSRARDEVDSYAEQVLKNNRKPRIKESDFIESFGQDEVEKDGQLITRLEEKFAEQLEHLPLAEVQMIKRGEKLGLLLEIIIAEQGEDFHWAGETAHFIRTSRYDDIVNSVDLIIEFEIDSTDQNQLTPHRVALAVDASQNVEMISQKMNRNLDKLLRRNGKKSPEIKYFQSVINPNIKGPLELVIPVVVGLEKNNTDHLTKLISNFQACDTKNKNKEYQETLNEKKQHLAELLKNHPAQTVFYREIRAQLTAYLKILISPDTQTALYRAEISSILNKFNHVKETKGNIDLGTCSSDLVMKTIENESLLMK